jgi:hypothetical protein
MKLLPLAEIFLEMGEGRRPAQFQRGTIVSSKLTPTSIPLTPNFLYQQLWHSV